ncbi:hypothetical protein BJ741DRAFT_618560 [Chytriomyces cf. hyalinus JEL632]|nr:hypothetical protein BJ741DRAFT_618560 [Chytriomyces cf. hyalinus JEL632]
MTLLVAMAAVHTWPLSVVPGPHWTRQAGSVPESAVFQQRRLLVPRLQSWPPRHPQPTVPSPPRGQLPLPDCGLCLCLQDDAGKVGGGNC